MNQKVKTNLPIARRDLFRIGAAAALTAGTRTAGAAPALSPDFPAVRNSFPWSQEVTYLNAAGFHPVSVQSARAMEDYLRYKTGGPGAGRQEFGSKDEAELKGLFGTLINAEASEIAFIQSTLMGENLVCRGLGFPTAGGNIVTDQLHYNGGLYLYQRLAQEGVEVRVVQHRDWRIEPSDFDQAIDGNTRLVSLTLVSNINGFLHGIQEVSRLAQARGAYLYADVVQAAAAVPMDVRAMGIDFCACSTYKWLMGERGFGYLYVRRELQREVLRTTLFGDRQYDDFQYHIFPFGPSAPPDFSWKERPDASCYEVGNYSKIAAAGQVVALKQILGWGVEKIQNHARPLVERLRDEVARLGYPCITPADSPAPIATFLVEDMAAVRSRLQKAKVTVKVKWNQMRISPAVFNDEEDVERLIRALA